MENIDEHKNIFDCRSYSIFFDPFFQKSYSHLRQVQRRPSWNGWSWQPWSNTGVSPGNTWRYVTSKGGNIGSLHTERVIGVGILGIYRWLPPIQANTTWGERYLIYGIVWNVQISNLKWPWMSTLGFISVLTMLHDPRTTTSRLKVWYRDFLVF